MPKIVCEKCEKDTETRIVLKHNPLIEVEADLPSGLKELKCHNIIKFKRKGRKINNWITEECRNRIIIKKIKVE